MAYHTDNKVVVEKLQVALQAFLEDHRQHRITHKDDEPNWEPPKDEPGCGCNDCLQAGELLGSIY
jgi:hypothetical protein